MPDIDSLGNSFYYAGVQNTSGNGIKNKKADKTEKSGKLSFSKLLKTEEENETQKEFKAAGLPEEIQGMEFDAAVMYLKDSVDNAGNALAESVSPENIEAFKNSVRQFVSFVVQNNYEVHSRKPFGKKALVSPVNLFSNFNTAPVPARPKIQIEVINKKLDELVQETLKNQSNNLKILEKADEIKGLIVDLLRA